MMAGKVWFWSLVLSILVMLGTIRANANSISTNQIIITFTVSNGSPLSDVFLLSGNGGTGFIGATAKIFNGGALLGSYTGFSTNPFFVWASSSSSFTFGSPTIIDFSSFQNGTIQGRIVITSNGTPLVIPSLTNFFVGFDGHGDPNGSSAFSVATVNIRSVTVVPEPASFLLLGTGLLGLLVVARKRR